jgi:hypothetical protein
MKCKSCHFCLCYTLEHTTEVKKETIKMNIGVVRELQKQQGYFDGRFVERTTPSKKQYTRKQKHRNSLD